MTSILITGSSGFIGAYLAKQFRANYEVVGLDIDDSAADTCDTFYCKDIRDRRSLESIFSSHAIDLVIHVAAAKHLVWCEENPDEASEINFNSTQFLHSLSSRNRAKFIYISSDQVFNGEGRDYREEDPRSAINKYGHTKVLCEKLLEDDSQVAICRTAMVFGKIPDNQRELFGKVKDQDQLGVQGFIIGHVLHQLQQGQSIILPADEFCNPTSNDLLYRQIKRVIDRDLTGILHCCGRERISRYQFGLKIALAFGLDCSLISSQGSNDPLRPKDVSMDVFRTQKIIGMNFDTIDTMIGQVLGETNESRS